jgi:polyhydroxyalkanoate synthase
MYCWYVRKTYLENRLREPGKTTVLSVPVDFSKVTVPAYVLATREDHIVPWRTAYLSIQLFGGEEKTFVLGASGHIAGIVNPPGKKRRSHWVFNSFPESPDDGLAAAKEIKGSWWPRWSEWLAQHSGGKRAAPAKPGNAKYKAIEPAPGRYVKQKA